MQYLQENGFKVTLVKTDDPEEIKDQMAVPENLRSCHTTAIGGYYVEGHVPVEAIRKLLEERPSVKGIALPGMPAGSPGMGGTKSGPFVIYAVAADGTSSEFMRV